MRNIFLDKYKKILLKIINNDNANIYYYLKHTEVKKLHLGCGENVISGWLNADCMPVD